VFQLGTAYSAAMNCVYLDEKGQPAPMQMGCYGIGVTRILGAAIEQNFDDKGIVWPDAIAPFELVLCPMGYDRSELVKAETDRLYAELPSGRCRRHRRRPRPASGRHVRRLGTGRRAAPRGDRRARPQGRQAGIPGPPRCRGNCRALPPTWSPSSKASWAVMLARLIRQASRPGSGSALFAALLLSSGARRAVAGNQKEEALADSVRLALERAIRDGRPPKPVFRDDRGGALPAVVRRHVGAPEAAPAGRAGAHRVPRGRPGTKRPAPASIRAWCWA
jgi:hypothetical protein